MKRVVLALAVIFGVLNISAENYPYRSDVLWLTVPDHADWLYETGENANIEVSFYKYGIPVDAEIIYELSDDMLPTDKTGAVKLKNGRAHVNIGTKKTPGFRDCKFTAKVDGQTYTHHVKVGFSPEKIVPFTQKPADFDSFWEKNVTDVRKLPLKYTMKESEKYTTDKFDAYLVKLEVNRAHQVIYGYLFVPKDAAPGSCPIVICPPGAGVKTIKEPMRNRAYPENGCIRFELEIHGLNPELEAEDFADISRAFNTGDTGYLHNGLDDKDSYYMKKVYLGLVRSVDFLTTLPEWDGRNVVMQGGSQGGALAIVGTALDPRVTACVVNHPALSDMAGYQNGGTGGYPHFHRSPGAYTPEKINTMAYYDVVNFARNLQVPIYMTWGYNDNVCPPTTSYAVWNVITSPKDALVTPINEHWTTEETGQRQLQWILNHLK